jgi:hypothetical protein
MAKVDRVCFTRVDVMNWFLYAVLSAEFAGLALILGTVGVSGIDSTLAATALYRLKKRTFLVSHSDGMPTPVEYFRHRPTAHRFFVEITDLSSFM